jgi:hypothetical protein
VMRHIALAASWLACCQLCRDKNSTLENFYEVIQPDFFLSDDLPVCCLQCCPVLPSCSGHDCNLGIAHECVNVRAYT